MWVTKKISFYPSLFRDLAEFAGLSRTLVSAFAALAILVILCELAVVFMTVPFFVYIQGNDATSSVTSSAVEIVESLLIQIYGADGYIFLLTGLIIVTVMFREVLNFLLVYLRHFIVGKAELSFQIKLLKASLGAKLLAYGGLGSGNMVQTSGVGVAESGKLL